MQRAEPLGPAQTCTLATTYGQQEGRALGPHSPRRLLQTPHRLPEPSWAPSWGQVNACCPCWARPGWKGWLVTCSVAAGRTGTPGVWLRARFSGSPPAPRSGSGGDSARTAGASSPPPRAGLPPPDPPPSQSHPPPAARFYGNRAMLRTDVLPGWTAGDVLFLHHTAVTRAQAHLP